MTRISVIIPTLNEEKAIGKVLAERGGRDKVSVYRGNRTRSAGRRNPDGVDPMAYSKQENTAYPHSGAAATGYFFWQMPSILPRRLDGGILGADASVGNTRQQ